MITYRVICLTGFEDVSRRPQGPIFLADNMLATRCKSWKICEGKMKPNTASASSSDRAIKIRQSRHCNDPRISWAVLNFTDTGIGGFMMGIHDTYRTCGGVVIYRYYHITVSSLSPIYHGLIAPDNKFECIYTDLGMPGGEDTHNSCFASYGDYLYMISKRWQLVRLDLVGSSPPVVVGEPFQNKTICMDIVEFDDRHSLIAIYDSGIIALLDTETLRYIDIIHHFHLGIKWAKVVSDKCVLILFGNDSLIKWIIGSPGHSHLIHTGVDRCAHDRDQIIVICHDECHLIESWLLAEKSNICRECFIILCLRRVGIDRSCIKRIIEYL